jgi:hypothetical protein
MHELNSMIPARRHRPRAQNYNHPNEGYYHRVTEKDESC